MSGKPRPIICIHRIIERRASHQSEPCRDYQFASYLFNFEVVNVHPAHNLCLTENN